MVLSDAATIIVNATIKVPAVIEKIRKTKSPVIMPFPTLVTSKPITTGATQPAAAEP